MCERSEQILERTGCANGLTRDVGATATKSHGKNGIPLRLKPPMLSKSIDRHKRQKQRSLGDISLELRITRKHPVNHVIEN